MSLRYTPGLAAALTVTLLACSRERSHPEPSRDATAPALDAATAATADDASRASDPAAPAPPAARSLAWRALGTGVFVRETDAPAGSELFVSLAGWRITAESARAWTDALYEARLRSLGVRWLFAVQGPAEVDHRSHELATGALAHALLERTVPAGRAVLVVAHSSGALVAAELFQRLFRTRPDGGSALRDRVLFVSLDGDADVHRDPLRRLEPETVAALRYAWFVTARDAVRSVGALSNRTALAQHRRYPRDSAFLEYDARDAGCTTPLCVHVSLVNARPFPRGNESYSRFGPEGPNTWWLEPVLTRWSR